jgi:hypothetical protein
MTRQLSPKCPIPAAFLFHNQKDHQVVFLIEKAMQQKTLNEFMYHSQKKHREIPK